MENLDRNEAVQASSDRSFGIVFTVVFALIALYPLIHGEPLRLWAMAVAAAFMAAALIRPQLLAPLNKLWFRFGMLLHRIVSPVAMGIIFFGAIMPMGLAMRALGKRPLRLDLDPNAKSYWIPREPPGPEARSMSDPF
jgi:hypothetical protein